MGVARKEYQRHGARVFRDKRWPALRMAAKRRDSFKCVECSARGDLEVDHVKPVRTHPELAFELSNLQCLCVACHARKTRIEVGWEENISPARRAWKDLVRDLQKGTGDVGIG